MKSWELLDPDSRAIIGDEMEFNRRLADRHKPFEMKIVKKGGEIRHVIVSNAAIELHEGKSEIFGMFHDITERKKTEEHIRYLSFHDHLTGLYNRAFVEEELRRLCISRDLPIGVLLCDVNGLKLVNDAFGHREGDKLLQCFVIVLRESCRKGDIICRWGGDEFILILPEASERNLESLQ